MTVQEHSHSTRGNFKLEIWSHRVCRKRWYANINRDLYWDAKKGISLIGMLCFVKLQFCRLHVRDMFIKFRVIHGRYIIKILNNIRNISASHNKPWTFISMVWRYPSNPRGTKNVFSDIRVLSIQIYVLSLSCLAMGINLVRDMGPMTSVSCILVHYKR